MAGTGGGGGGWWFWSATVVFGMGLSGWGVWKEVLVAAERMGRGREEEGFMGPVGRPEA